MGCWASKAAVANGDTANWPAKTYRVELQQKKDWYAEPRRLVFTFTVGPAHPVYDPAGFRTYLERFHPNTHQNIQTFLEQELLGSSFLPKAAGEPDAFFHRCVGELQDTSGLQFYKATLEIYVKDVLQGVRERTIVPATRVEPSE